MIREREFEYSSHSKVFSIDGIVAQLDVLETVSIYKQGEKHISGLVTGCFDILHLDQVEFLRKAKGKVNTLIVGIDRDKTVALKDLGRPIFGLKQRCEMLASLDCVDLVFPIPFVLKSYEETPENAALFEELTDKLFNFTSPPAGIHCLITNEVADKFWREKAKRAEKIGINYIGLKVERHTSSTEVAVKIQTGY